MALKKVGAAVVARAASHNLQSGPWLGRSLICAETLRRTQVDSGHGTYEAVETNEGEILREEKERTRFLLSFVRRQDLTASDRCCAQPGGTTFCISFFSVVALNLPSL